MRRILLAFALLAACQITAPQGTDGGGASAIPGDAITVTSLDDAAAVEAAPASPAGTPRPKPRPAMQAEPVAGTPLPTEPAVLEEPEAPKSAEQQLCERTGGQWAVAGKSGAFACVKSTRDGGKVCTSKGDCQGMCLARSGTCAPFMPLFGCNEILEKDGRRVTLCID